MYIRPLFLLIMFFACKGFVCAQNPARIEFNYQEKAVPFDSLLALEVNRIIGLDFDSLATRTPKGGITLFETFEKIAYVVELADLNVQYLSLTLSYNHTKNKVRKLRKIKRKLVRTTGEFVRQWNSFTST